MRAQVTWGSLLSESMLYEEKQRKMEGQKLSCIKLQSCGLCCDHSFVFVYLLKYLDLFSVEAVCSKVFRLVDVEMGDYQRNLQFSDWLTCTTPCVSRLFTHVVIL